MILCWKLYVILNIHSQAFSLGGKEAVEKLNVVLHINLDQESEITQELLDREFYG